MDIPKLRPIDPNKPRKPKILLLSDDLRLHSGIGTMSNSFVKNTIHKYDWIQVGGAVNHPDAGKLMDVSEDLANQTGVTDASCVIYPVSGYGNPDLVRNILANYQIDAILHFTDPRFWDWLYHMEHELRQRIPIMYYNIWDDLPFPHWNENAYESCDLIMAISKQTYNINKHVCQRKPRIEGKDLTYVQHGIDEDIYKPLDSTDSEYLEMKQQVLGDKEYDFIAYFNSRNIRRKSPSDLILGYRMFCDMLTKEEAEKCCLLFHTDPVDPNGTDLPAVVHNLCRSYDVIFSNQKIPNTKLNCLYNMSDVTCNPSSAEGFGLSHMESLMAGTPTIATVVGGLQDQMGFKINGEEFNVKHLTGDIPSNSTGELSTEHGEWTLPLWPQLNVQGSPSTPYIYDSRPSVNQIANQLKVWYDMGREERKRRGMSGRNWAIKNKFTAKGMAEAMSESIDNCLKSFEKRKRFTIIDPQQPMPKYKEGVLLR